MVEPTLSSIIQPGFDMGKEATKMLLKMIDGENAVVQYVVKLETKLKIRESTKRQITLE